MPLTPEDVSNKRFTPVRLREGYDMGEVDQFLDEVEAELARLTSENEQLRSGLPAGGGVADRPATPVEDGDAAGSTATDPRPAQPVEPDPAAESTPPAAAQPAPAQVESLQVTTASEASTAAVRLLEIATRNADELVGEARDEAQRILDEARTTSDQVEVDARSRAELLDSETEERRAQLLGDLNTEKQRLGGEVENLRSFEREYRARLKTYFEQQLDSLNGTGQAGELSRHQAPGRSQ